MKLRITREDLSQLTEEQKQNLNDLWIPEVYDVAVAKICKDAEKEIYEDVVFVIGGIQLSKHGNVTVYDIRFIDQFLAKPDEENADAVPEEEAEQCCSDDEEECIEDEDCIEEEEEFIFDMSLPTSYMKEDCVPLLNIGQMIDILRRRNYGEGDFFITATIGDYTCDMGKNDTSVASLDSGYESAELCDVLWESVKALL